MTATKTPARKSKKNPKPAYVGKGWGGIALSKTVHPDEPCQLTREEYDQFRALVEAVFARRPHARRISLSCSCDRADRTAMNRVTIMATQVESDGLEWSTMEHYGEPGTTRI